MNDEQPDSSSANALEANEEQLRRCLYETQVEIERLQHLAETAATPEEAKDYLAQLGKQRRNAQETEQSLQELLATQRQKVDAAKPADKSAGGTTRGMHGLVTEYELDLTPSLIHVPTAICHLLERKQFALLRGTISNKGTSAKSVRVRTWVEGYSAEAVSTQYISGKKSASFSLLPTFHAGSIHGISELTRATLHVSVDDLEKDRVISHDTAPIWLLARNSAPLKVRQRDTAEWEDMRDFLAAFVTPHEPTVMKFLREIAERLPGKKIQGYAASGQVETQVRTVYETLVQRDLAYVTSFIDFNPDGDSQSQRVRLPRETLKDRQGNCVDGALLFASLLEAMSLRPALVVVPGHAIVAWKPSRDASEWRYLDTTKFGTSDFATACRFGDVTVEEQQGSADMRILDIADLRAKGITPLE